MTQASVLSTAGYVYNGDGKRVEKTASSSPYELYWYDAAGNVLDETDGSGNLTDEYVFFNGSRIARRDSSSNIDYYFADHLGSARVVTNASGTILDDCDYYPYGGLISTSCTTSGNNYKFTGKKRDSESNLDNFGARYDSSAMGRFMGPDPDGAGAVEPDPQSWNAYAYVRNNPVTFTDPDGRACVSNDGGKTYHDDSGGQTCAEADAPANNAKPSVVVTVSIDELNLMMLQSIGNSLSSPRQWADLAKNGLEYSTPGGMIAGTVAQCGLEKCSKTGVAMALLPLLPVGGEVGAVLVKMGIPEWAQTAGGFVNWLRNLQKAGVKLTSEEADAIIETAKALEVDVRLDPPHGAGNPWNVPHLNIGNEGQVHLEVPNGYDNPSVPKGSVRRP